MFKEIQKDGSLVKLLLVLLIITVSVHLLSIFWQVISLFSDIIGIVVLAWLLSFVLEPLADYISGTLKISKPFATTLTYLLILIALIGISVVFVPLFTRQMQTLSHTLPLFLASSPKFMSKWVYSLTDSLTNAIVLLPTIAQFVISTIVVLVISFYFVMDRDRINREFFYLTPKDWHEKMRFIQKVIASAFGSFVRIQIIIGILIGISTWVVLTILRVDFALAIAVLAGILGALPFVGPVLAVIPPALFTFIIDPWIGLITLVILVIIQQVIFNVFVPKALGKALQVHPVIIILSLIVGFKLAGALGAVFAIPVAGISIVILRDIWHYFLDEVNK